jgi:hypothetical protein
MKGKINKTNILKTSAITPPSLFGIALKIAYANKKYHSGIIWTGVTRGLASIKFSGSPNKLGTKNTKKVINNPNNINP